MYEVCSDAAADGVRYLEVRFSPILHLEKGLTMTQVLEAVLDGAWQANFNLPIVARVIVCGMRQLPGEVTEKIAEIAWRYKEKGVVGFDLAGPEKGFSSKKHKVLSFIVTYSSPLLI